MIKMILKLNWVKDFFFFYKIYIQIKKEKLQNKFECNF